MWKTFGETGNSGCGQTLDACMKTRVEEQECIQWIC